MPINIIINSILYSTLLRSLTISSMLFHLKVFLCFSNENSLRSSSTHLHQSPSFLSNERSEDRKSSCAARGSAPDPLNKESEVWGKYNWYL